MLAVDLRKGGIAADFLHEPIEDVLRERQCRIGACEFCGGSIGEWGFLFGAAVIGSDFGRLGRTDQRSQEPEQNESRAELSEPIRANLSVVEQGLCPKDQPRDS